MVSFSNYWGLAHNLNMRNIWESIQQMGPFKKSIQQMLLGIQKYASYGKTHTQTHIAKWLDDRDPNQAKVAIYIETKVFY